MATGFKNRKYYFIKNIQQPKVIAPEEPVFGLNNDIQSLVPMICAYRQIETDFNYNDGFSRIIGYMANAVENSIDSGLEEKVYSYHKALKVVINKYKNEKSADLYDKRNALKYHCMNNMKTIKIEQEYKGKRYNADFSYLGVLNREFGNNQKQIQSAFVYLNPPIFSSLRYEFTDYNLDDTHGYTMVLIENDKIVSIETARDKFAPIKTKYFYDENGKLISAVVTNYLLSNSGMKNAMFFFDEIRKTNKVYYGYRTTKRIGDKFRSFVDAEFVKNSSFEKFKLKRKDFSY